MAALGACSTSVTFFKPKIDLIQWLLYFKAPLNVIFNLI